MNERRTLGVASQCFFYEIAGKPYYQQALSATQAFEVFPIIINLFDEFEDAEEALHSLTKDDLCRVLEVVLVPCGVSMEDHCEAINTPGNLDVEGRGVKLLAALTFADLIQLADDFLACNLQDSLLTQVKGIMERLVGAVKGFVSNKMGPQESLDEILAGPSPSLPEATH